jgi:hypothetical protein
MVDYAESKRGDIENQKQVDIETKSMGVSPRKATDPPLMKDNMCNTSVQVMDS